MAIYTDQQSMPAAPMSTGKRFLSYFVRTNGGHVPARLIVALAMGFTGLFFAFVSLWARINELNQWGTFGMRFGFLVLLALPLAVTSLSVVSSYKMNQWRELGMVRMILTTAIGAAGLTLSIVSTYVMYNALP